MKLCSYLSECTPTLLALPPPTEEWKEYNEKRRRGQNEEDLQSTPLLVYLQTRPGYDELQL